MLSLSFSLFFSCQKSKDITGIDEDSQITSQTNSINLQALTTSSGSVSKDFTSNKSSGYVYITVNYQVVSFGKFNPTTINIDWGKYHPTLSYSSKKVTCGFTTTTVGVIFRLKNAGGRIKIYVKATPAQDIDIRDTEPPTWGNPCSNRLEGVNL